MTILPSPIPHPLDYSPWDLPGWAYEALEWVVGFDWPEGNEKTTWDLADQWYDLVDAMAAPRQDAADAAGQFIAAYGGGGTTIDAFVTAWKEVAEGEEAPLNALVAFAAEMGKVVDECAQDIEAAKLEAWIELGLFVIELIGLAVTVALTLGAASPVAGGLIAATRMAIQQIFKRLIAQLSKKAIKAAVKETAKRAGKDLLTKKGLQNLGKKALKEGRQEAREEFLTNLGVQAYQAGVGHSDGIDLGDLGRSTLAGAAGGASAHGAMIGAGNRSGMFRGAAGEVFGELGGSAAGGQLPSFEDLAKAGTSGAAGSAVGNTRQAFSDFGSSLDGAGGLKMDGSAAGSSPVPVSSSFGTGGSSPTSGLSTDSSSSSSSPSSFSSSSSPPSAFSSSSSPPSSSFSSSPSSLSSSPSSSSLPSFSDGGGSVAGHSSSPSSSYSPSPSSPSPSSSSGFSDASAAASSSGHVAASASAHTGSPTATETVGSPAATETVQATTVAADHVTSSAGNVTLSSVAPPVEAPAAAATSAGVPSSAAPASVAATPAASPQSNAPVAFAPSTGSSHSNVSLAGGGPTTTNPAVGTPTGGPNLTSPSTNGASPHHPPVSPSPTTSPAPAPSIGNTPPVGNTPTTSAPITGTTPPVGNTPATGATASTSVASPVGTATTNGAAPGTVSPGRTDTAVPAQPGPVSPGDKSGPSASAAVQPGPARTDPSPAGTSPFPVPFQIPPRTAQDHQRERDYFAELGRNKQSFIRDMTHLRRQALTAEIAQERADAEDARRNALRAARNLDFRGVRDSLTEEAGHRKAARDAAARLDILVKDPEKALAGQWNLKSSSAFRPANTDRGDLSGDPIWSNDQSAIPGAGQRPNSRQSRPYRKGGGLRVPLKIHQADLERAIPRDAGLRPERNPDPRRPWLQLVNDGGPSADPTRGVNCLDCSLSFLETYLHGRPTVSAPRTIDTYGIGEIDKHVGEFNGHLRAEQATGSGFTQLAPFYGDVANDPRPPAVVKAAVDHGFQQIIDTLAMGGHGSTAVIINVWGDGSAHAWNAVNHNGTILFVDPQSGRHADSSNFSPAQNRTLYGHDGTLNPGNVVALNSLMVDGSGNPMAVPNTPPAPFYSNRSTPPPPPLAYQLQQQALQQQPSPAPPVSTQPSPLPPPPPPPPAPTPGPAPTPAPTPAPAPDPAPTPAPAPVQPDFNDVRPDELTTRTDTAPDFNDVRPDELTTRTDTAPDFNDVRPDELTTRTDTAPDFNGDRPEESTVRTDAAPPVPAPVVDDFGRTESESSPSTDAAPNRPVFDPLAVLDPESMNGPVNKDPLSVLDPHQDAELAQTSPAPDPTPAPPVTHDRESADAQARENYLYEGHQRRRRFADAHRQETAQELRKQARDRALDAEDRRRAITGGDLVDVATAEIEAARLQAEADDLFDQARAVEGDAPMDDVLLTGNDWEIVNDSASDLAPGPIETDDTSALTGNDRPPSADRTRPYNRRGGLRPPLKTHQTDLERAMPRDRNGDVIRHADPRDGDWFGLQNDGGPELDPTRSNNCGDNVLSLFETYMHARPRVSAPRTFDGYHNGDPSRPIGAEDGVTARIEDTVGGRFEGLTDASTLNPDDARVQVKMAEINLRAHLTSLGHGAFAFIETQDQAGRTHAFAAVNQNGTILYLDPQTRQVSTFPIQSHSGLDVPGDVVRMDALVVDGQAEISPMTANDGPFISEDPAGKGKGRRQAPDVSDPDLDPADDNPLLQLPIGSEVTNPRYDGCPIEITSKVTTDEHGKRVIRNYIDDVDGLWDVADFLTDGLVLGYKYIGKDYYVGQNPDGEWQKIEVNMKGHPNTGEGPHVKLMLLREPERGLESRWRTAEKVFVKYRERLPRR
ncbi:toxin glutamine deamidase domain-containing protein [Actinoplanes sp. CA-252034]|uniref:toxin glutamine deamidase domain-containing protein n=1 Tax=Actinoplanes sp. CA-252034 TaxID=3239906 RepID=UPI003D96792C